ncbi:MAG: TolC family protein [Candidatus Kapabacteria bacterium]|nr:TolC family protein [Candidatus Kapabacteria bacterium]
MNPHILATGKRAPVSVGLCIALALTVTSCVPPVVQRSVDRSVPQRYSPTDDTAATAPVPWRDYYRDSNLVALIDSALVHNQELNIVLQEVEIASNEVLARSGEYLPFVNLRAGAGAEKPGRFTRNGAVEEQLEVEPGRKFPSPLPDFLVSATVSWEVDVWNRLRSATKAAALRYAAAGEGARFLVTNLVAELASSYYELMALDNLLSAIDANIVVLTNALATLEQQKQSARTTELAVRRFEAEVKKNESHRFEIAQRIVEVENRVNVLVGRFPQRVPRASSMFADVSMNIPRPGSPTSLLEHRPDIRRAEQTMQAAELDVVSAKARFYPSLALMGGIGYQAINAQLLLTTPESLMFGLAGELLMPVLNRRAIVAGYNTANAAQTQAMLNYERTLRTSVAEVSNAQAKVANLAQAYTRKQQQVEAMKKSVEAAQTLFSAARADYLEVLMTQRDALEASMELIETKVEQIRASIELYRALGGGWQ